MKERNTSHKQNEYCVKKYTVSLKKTTWRQGTGAHVPQIILTLSDRNLKQQ